MNIGRLIDNLIKHEGTVIRDGRHQMYKDTVGKVTIGFGRNLTDKGISEHEARVLLNNDVQEVISGLRNKFWWFDNLDDVRQEVVINMAFNLGIAGFEKFRNTISYISEGDFEQAAKAMLQSRWAGQVGQRAVELAQEMETGNAI